MDQFEYSLKYQKKLPKQSLILSPTFKRRRMGIKLYTVDLKGRAAKNSKDIYKFADEKNGSL